MIWETADLRSLVDIRLWSASNRNDSVESFSNKTSIVWPTILHSPPLSTPRRNVCSCFPTFPFEFFAVLVRGGSQPMFDDHSVGKNIGGITSNSDNSGVNFGSIEGDRSNRFNNKRRNLTRAFALLSYRCYCSWEESFFFHFRWVF